MKPCAASIEAYLQAHQNETPDEETLAQRRQTIYALAGTTPEEHTFVCTHSGAEAVNQVLLSIFLEVARKEGKCHFLASSLVDEPTRQMLKRLETLGCAVKMVPTNAEGMVDLAALETLVNPRTALLSVPYVDPRTGVIQPIEALATFCRDRQIPLHIEGDQALGQIALSLSDIGVDYFTFSGAPIHAITGCGGLFAKAGRPLLPLVVGKEEDTAALLACSAAAQQAIFFLDAMSLEVGRLRAIFEVQLSSAQVLFADQPRVPHLSALSFPRIHAEALTYYLRRKGIQVRQLDERAVRFAFSRYTTQAEIDRTLQVVTEVVAHLHTLSEDLDE